MLTLSERAATVIRALLDETDLPKGAGLRLAQRDDHPALSMQLCPRPLHGDVVLIDHDVRLFLGPVAARRTHLQSLDVEVAPTHRALYLRD